MWWVFTSRSSDTKKFCMRNAFGSACAITLFSGCSAACAPSSSSTAHGRLLSAAGNKLLWPLSQSVAGRTFCLSCFSTRSYRRSSAHTKNSSSSTTKPASEAIVASPKLLGGGTSGSVAGTNTPAK